MAEAPFSVNLADIRFSFSNLSARDFRSFFHLFHDPNCVVSNHCAVEVTGANPRLAQQPATGAWAFAMDRGMATVTGGNPAGETLWRMTGYPPYERLVFEWHPTAFDAMYSSETYGSYGIVVTLALALRLLDLDGLAMHGSAQLIDGEAIICAGPSGHGKSTLSRLFDRSGVQVLTDERPILRATSSRADGGFRVYGSPWPSSGGFALNASGPLRKIYFIEHGPEPEIKPLSRRDALLRLLDVSLVPWLDQAFFDPAIRTLERLIERVPYALLRFRPDGSVVEAVRRDLSLA